MNNLREFLSLLEDHQLVKQIDQPINPALEVTEISDRVLRRAGPALLFNQPSGSDQKMR